MASQNRNERQLMRQRGVGNRSASNVDFGLNFGLENSRQDRQQMRQRGAGNRKVENVDFGFTFRNSAQSKRSASRASNSSLINARRPSKTPGRDSHPPSVRSIRRSTSRASSGPSHGLSREWSIQPDSEDIRLSRSQHSITIEENQRQLPRNHAQPLSPSQRKKSSMFAIVEAPDEQDPYIGNVEEDGSSESSQLLFPNEIHEKENAEPDGVKPPTKKSKRKSIGQKSLQGKKRSFSSSSTSQNDQQITRNSRSSVGPSSPSEPADSEHEEPPKQPIHTIINKKPSAGPAKSPLRRRKKRKSVVLVKKKRVSSQGTGAQPRTLARARGVVPRHEEEAQEEGEDSELFSRRGTSRQSSPTSRPSPIVRSIEVGEPSDEEYVDEDQSPEPPTPANLKKGAKKAKSQTIKKATKARTQSGSSTFPILTHRMTNVDALPTIQEQEVDSNADDGENVTGSISGFSDRAVPNAIEVLAQICRETVEAAIERLETNPREEARAVRQRKRGALEAFGTDLDDRLLDMSAAVEDRVHLEARVRKVKREKTDLQARWIEVRKQRERIALRCDHVREQHWENERAREERWLISEAARKAELELDGETPDEDESIEFLLRIVAEEVTNAHDCGGFLHRMQSMNGQLERMAAVLEGRPG